MKTYNYDEILEKYGKYARQIQGINLIYTYVYTILYPLLLIYLYISKSPKLISMICIPFISFILVSIVRKRINKPRPYETHFMKPIIPKNSTGNSMPSRHVFSSTIVSMCFLYVYKPLGILLVAFSLCGAFVRVIGGVHYKEDVIAGFLIGIVCGFFIFI